MTDALWPDDKVISTLDNATEKRLPYATVYSAIGQIIADYEADRATKEQTISDLQAQVATAGANNAMLNATVADLDATIDTLHIQVTDLLPDITVTVGATPIMTSRFETGVNHVSSAALLYAPYKQAGMAALSKAITYHQVHLMGWGTLDPWQWNGTGTRPAEPTNWASLDAFMQMILAMGGKPVLNTQLYSWHLKGKWQADNTTVPMTYAEAFSDTGVLLKSQEAAYLLLIQRMAERYLVAPYNCRVWVTGTEFHGLYLGRQRNYNEWRWDAYAGTAGANADMGMAYIHNITTDKIIQVAAAKGIDPASLTIIPNYPSLYCMGTPTSDSVPVGHVLRDRPWGTADKHGPSILKNMPPLLNRYDAIGFDTALGNKDGVTQLDDFAQASKFDDLVAYVDATVPGKPKAVLEMYDGPQSKQGTPQYRAALRAESWRRMLLSGVWAIFPWGTAGAADSNPPDSALLDTNGNATPMLDVVRLFHELAPPGTAIYDATVTGDGVSVLAGDKGTILISTSDKPHKVALGGDVYALAPFDVRGVN